MSSTSSNPRTTAKDMKPVNKLHQRLLQDCVAMTGHALTEGKKVDSQIIKIIEEASEKLNSGSIEEASEKQKKDSESSFSASDLIQAHNQLARLIAPAKPHTLCYEQRYFSQGDSKWRNMRIPPVGKLIILAIIFMVIFVATSLAPSINGEQIGKDFTAVTWDNGGLVYFLFLLSIAGLGASFSTLFRANRYMKRCTFDSRHMSSYYTQLLLGMIAGLFISQLVDVNASGDMLNLFSKPTLALLGGFSSNVVYRILKQMLGAFESVFTGAAEDIVETERKLSQIDAEQAVQESRLKMAQELISLRSELPQEAQSQFDVKISKLLTAPTIA